MGMMRAIFSRKCVCYFGVHSRASFCASASCSGIILEATCAALSGGCSRASINSAAHGGMGMLPKVVQERLGHSTIALTMDTYGHCRGKIQGNLPSSRPIEVLHEATRSL